jgi:SAM-dependent methyltransferase
VARFYHSRPGWVDGTTKFHRLCTRHIPKNSRICEIGPGLSNSTTEFLAKLPGFLVGLDIDGYITGNKFLHKAVIYDGKNFPFAAASLDAVVADYVHEHLVDPLAMCREISRVLVEGGFMVLRTPNKYHYVPLVARFTPHWFHRRVANNLRGLPPEAADPSPTFYRCNTEREIRRILRTAGLNVISLEFIESQPSYGMASRWLFLPFMLYERLVNSTSRLAGLRSNILCVASKPITRSSSLSYSDGGKEVTRI